MPTATIQVAAVTSQDAWNLEGAANKVIAVNSPDDDLTTLIYSLVGGDRQQYSLASNTIPSNAIINSVSVRSRCTCNHNSIHGSINVSLWQGANSSYSADHSLPLSLVWANFTDSLPRPSGGNWSQSDLAALEVRITNAVSLVDVCTSLWLLVDYSLPSASMFLLFP